MSRIAIRCETWLIHTWTSHVPYTIKSCPIYQYDVRHDSFINEWVMSHIRISHVPYSNTMWDMTHPLCHLTASSVDHDLFVCATWIIHITLLSFATGIPPTLDVTPTCVCVSWTWVISMWDTTPSRDSFIVYHSRALGDYSYLCVCVRHVCVCETCVCVWDMRCCYVGHDPFIWHGGCDLLICEKWLVHMTHSYARCDSLICGCIDLYKYIYTHIYI